MAERKPRMTLNDLGAAFGVPPPQDRTADSRQQTDTYYQLPLVEKLRVCSSTEGKGLPKSQRYERLGDAIAGALTLDKEKRAQLGIRIIVIGDINADGALTIKPDSTNAKVCVLFPTNVRGNSRVIEITDTLLAQNEQIDSFSLIEHADIVRQETNAERQNRLILTIKQIDAQIGDQKRYSSQVGYAKDGSPLQRQVTTRNVTGRMEELNRYKTIAIRDYLQTTLGVEEESDLAQLFVWEPVSNLHGVLHLKNTADRNVLARAINAANPEALTVSRRVASTNINREKLQECYDAYRAAPDAVAEHVRAGYDTWMILHRPDIQQREQLASPQKKVTEVAIPPELTEFAKLPLPDQLAGALRSIETTKGDKLGHEVANRKRDIAIRSALEAAPDQREGIQFVAIAPLDAEGKIQLEDSEQSQYTVYALFTAEGKSKFFKASRKDIASALRGDDQSTHDELLAIDALVNQRSRLIPEQRVDTYKRRITEIKMLDRVLQQLYGERKNEDVTRYRAISEKIAPLQGKKDILLASYLELADLQQGDSQNPLYSFSVDKENDERFVTVRMEELLQRVSIPYLLGRTTAPPPAERSQRYQQTNLRVASLEADEATFNTGDETEANGAAVFILDKLRELGVIGQSNSV